MKPHAMASDSAENSAAPRSTPVGIDLGTTMSTVAYVDASGELTVLQNSAGDPLTPSALFFTDTEVVIGQEAVRRGVAAPDSYAESFKRQMGYPHFNRKIRDRNVPPEVLSAFVLEQLKDDAERVLGPVTDAVITVPAYYDERRRKATQEAGRLAGFNVLDIINEPTAAAVAHGYLAQRNAGPEQDSASQRVLVYDLGGGTFDVSVLQIDGRKFSTLATDGDVQLGGNDFDERLVDFLAEQFLAQHGTDPRSDPADMQRLWSVARETKHALTDDVKHTAVCTHAGLRMGIEVGREQFEELIELFIERTLNTCGDVIHDAKLTWQSIDRILLVGGCSRIPLVARRLRELTGLEPMLPEAPELLVARGSALHAAARGAHDLLDDAVAFDVVNVNSHSLGIAGTDMQTLQPINKVLIPRNTALPTRATFNFVTRRPDQRTVMAKLLEGESENPKFCTTIGKCVVRLDAGLPEGTEVEVSCQYEADGTIVVWAHVPMTRSAAKLEFRRDGFGELEPLAVWHGRLTSGKEPIAGPDGNMSAPVPASTIPESPDESLSDSSDLAEVIRRLDELHTAVGKLGSHAAVPAAALPAQRLLHTTGSELAFAQQVLGSVQRAHTKATDRYERTQLASLVAQVRSHLSQAQTLSSHAQVVLGRECVEHGFCPAGAEPYLEEIRRLQTLADSAK